MKLNQSVQKGIAILRAAGTKPSGETASGLTRSVGLPWTTTVRLIRTLEAEGFLRRLPDTDRYVLGPELARLARSGDHGSLLAAVARPALERLADELGETVNLTVVQPNGRLEVLEQVDPPRLLRPTDYAGVVYPLHASSIGKLLLSTYDDVRLDAILSSPLPRYAQATITSPEALRDEIERIRATGFSTAVDELEDGLAALSVGVVNDGELIGMVSVSGPSSRFDATARAAALERVQEAAKTIQRQIVDGGAPSASRQVARGTA